MDPISKTDLAALRTQRKIAEKNAFIAQIVKDVYNVVTAKARDTDEQNAMCLFSRFSNLAEFPNTNNELVAQIEALFPECVVKYGLPDTDVSGQELHYIAVSWGDDRNDPEPDPTPGPPPVPLPT